MKSRLSTDSTSSLYIGNILLTMKFSTCSCLTKFPKVLCCSGTNEKLNGDVKKVNIIAFLHVLNAYTILEGSVFKTDRNRVSFLE